MIRVAVVGAGLIGKERLAAIRKLAGQRKPVALSGIYDADRGLCEQGVRDFGGIAFSSLDELLESRSDWILVALPHDAAMPVAGKALETGASVLLEKPMGRDLIEAERLLQQGGGRLHIGFNYRFYKGIAKALSDIKSGRFGDLVSVDMLLGHGCFPGQEKTWKLNDQRAGGGCLIDPGVHLLDLCLRIAPGGLKVVGAQSWRGFWNTGIEEDVSILLSAGTFSINLRISIVHWRSMLRIDINGSDAYGVVSGRNRSYGNQTYTVGPRWGWRSAPNQIASEKLELETDGNDVFTDETEALLLPQEAAPDQPHAASAAEGYAVMTLLDEIRTTLNLRRDYSTGA
jgi:predicted dehydrogenase